jgi:uncharacterized protein YjiS (DUF1127 family)
MLRTLHFTMAPLPHPRGSLLALTRTQFDRAIRIINIWVDRSRQRRALGEMAGLDDHLLRDIGVARDAALREASKPFWR